MTHPATRCTVVLGKLLTIFEYKRYRFRLRRLAFGRISSIKAEFTIATSKAEFTIAISRA